MRASIARSADACSGLMYCGVPTATPGLGQRLTERTSSHREGPRNAEVRDQRLPVRREQDVLRLHVAVDHPVAVRVIQRECGLSRDPDRFVERQLMLAADPVPQAFALHIGHGEPQLAGLGLTGVVNREDVRVLEAEPLARG